MARFELKCDWCESNFCKVTNPRALESHRHHFCSQKCFGSWLTKRRWVGKEWSKEEESILKENWLKKTQEELLDLFSKRSWNAILHRAFKLGLGTRRQVFPRLRKRTVKHLSSEDRAYLAAIIDGEGTISIYYDPSPHGTIGPCVQIVGTDDNLLAWLKQKVGEVSINYNRGSSGSLAWRYSTGGVLNVRSIIEQVFPFLIVKERQAELVLEFCRLYPKNKKDPRLFEIMKTVRQLNIKPSHRVERGR